MFSKLRKKNIIKNLYNFGGVFGVDFGSPRAPSEAKTIDFAGRVVQNRRSTFSRPGASGVDFRVQNGAKMDPKSKTKRRKMCFEIRCEISCKKVTKMMPKWFQNGVQIGQDKGQKSTKKQGAKTERKKGGAMHAMRPGAYE